LNKAVDGQMVILSNTKKIKTQTGIYRNCGPKVALTFVCFFGPSLCWWCHGCDDLTWAWSSWRCS